MRRNNKVIIGCSILFLWIAAFIVYKPIRNVIPTVDFDRSMQKDLFKNIVNTEWGTQVYDILKGVYEKNKPSLIKSSQQPKIPKIIHQIWLGSPFPEQYKAFAQSWKTYHPDWEYKLWTDVELDTFPMINRALFNATNNYGEKSDIARYEILYQYGGLYVDTDYECVQPFDAFHHYYDFYIGIQPLDTNYVQLGIGLIGAAPQHPILKAAIDNLYANRNVPQIVAKTGPIYFTRIFCAMAPKISGNSIAFPATYFYPRGYYQTMEEKNNWLKPESYAIHHWAGSWLKKEGFVR